VTGSNSVNVFLGLGLPWMIAAIYWNHFQSAESTDAWHARYAGEAWYDKQMPIGFAVPAGSLGFSVAVFTTCALVCLSTLLLRRATIGYELGMAATVPTAIFFVMLWIAYITISIVHEAAGGSE